MVDNPGDRPTADSEAVTEPAENAPLEPFSSDSGPLSEAGLGQDVDLTEPDLNPRAGRADRFRKSEPETLGSLSTGIQIRPYNPQEVKDKSAQRIAFGLVLIFGGFVGLMLIATIVVLLLSENPQEASEYSVIVESVLGATGNFATAVFAPLLAFVLGYYFGEKTQAKSSQSA